MHDNTRLPSLHLDESGEARLPHEPAPSPRRRRSGRRQMPAALSFGAGVALLSLAFTACTATPTTESVATQTSAAQEVEQTQAATASFSSTTSGTIAETAAAAQAFLATLSESQLAQVGYAYDDESKSTSWSNFPVTFVQRAGLNLADLSEDQQAAALAVLEALLNDEAYEMVAGIMAGDQYIGDYSSSTEDSLGQYYLAFFGDPGDTDAWTLQFGGHHLGINATLDGASDAITFAPTHLGVQPAEFTDASGTEIQAFSEIYADAFALYDSLTEAQLAQVYQGSQPAAMVCAPGDSCDYPTGTGLAASELSEEQRELLLELISNWAAMADEETNASELAKIEATLDETYLNWSGATVYDMSQGEGISFQISGPDVYIEFAAQQGSAGADVSGVVTSGWGHVHTIYRDPSGDYAGSVTQQAASAMGGGSGGPGGSAGPR